MSLSLDKSLGVYVSVPFCASKCSYCNFASGVFARDRMAPYVERLVREIRGARERAVRMGAELPHVLDSIYFGGGTPSLLPPDLFAQIAAALRADFELSSKVEWTIECAPGQLSAETLGAMTKAGVNRLSFGVQSFVDREAAAVGRLHTRRVTEDTVEFARASGISNINVDLLAGLPHQTEDSWRESVEAAIDLDVPHASVYMLEVDDDSRLGRELLVSGGKYHAHTVPGDDAIASFYEVACDRLNDAGIRQYEISNFARDGYESRHNLRYWRRGPYIGFGLDAHSCLQRADGGAIRFANSDDLAGYVAGRAGVEEIVDSKAQLEEAWFLGLRRNSGVNLADVGEKFGNESAAKFRTLASELADEGLVEFAEQSLRLTSRGRLLSNEVFSRFL
jgi:oxygen-independent coproporphyrinogen-3 oxidase